MFKNKNKNIKYKYLNNQQGFTILETLIAVLLLSLVLNAVFTLIAGTLFNAQYSKNEMVASYLAQEVVDSVRNTRDTYMQDPNTGWDRFRERLGLDLNNPVRRYCAIDTSPTNSDQLFTNSEIECSNAPEDSRNARKQVMYYDQSASGGSFYTTDDEGNTPTLFTRQVFLRRIDDNRVDLTVTISWTNGSIPKTKTIRSSFMNW
jgi:Tfp pilus assembly protein PilV